MAPVIEEINKELAKPQEERVDIKIAFTNYSQMKTFKGRLNTLKQQNFRNQWLGKFEAHMLPKHNQMEIRFNLSRKLTYAIVRDGVRGFQIESSSPLAIVAGPVKELTESEASMFILGDPDFKAARFLLSMFSQESFDYFNDPLKHETPALANLLKRRNLKWKVEDGILQVYA